MCGGMFLVLLKGSRGFVMAYLVVILGYFSYFTIKKHVVVLIRSASQRHFL